MEDHGGDIALADVEGGEGAEVTLTFPFSQKNLKGSEDEQKRLVDRV
jgi:nitrogen fixation/metabolism regulation signal transduction histidine kinase